MAKSHITRTFGPIHFEDLEPHRFEDLVRQLIYDLREWQSIEATGRSGSDDGFDVRAYERELVTFPAEDAEDLEEPRSEGRLWMIQCKREAELGPARVVKIIRENVQPENIPYGYILVASTNFSKRSYDVFRAELRYLGVTEFYLWGKAELEDMLFMPKYDRLLFTFFGVSIVTKRRSLTTEILATITIKNKLLRIWGGQFHDLRNDVLIRLINDEDYPFIGEKFSSYNYPKWFVAQAKGYFTKGIVVKIHEYFAYIDVDKKEWDYTIEVDTFARPHDRAYIDELTAYSENCQKLEEYCSYMRAANQAKISVLGLLRFDNILLIDDKGDLLHPYPHIFSEQKYEFGVFSKIIYRIKQGDERFDVEEDGFKRITHFPEKIPTVPKGKIHAERSLSLPAAVYRQMKYPAEIYKAYSFHSDWAFLSQGDIIQVDDSEQRSEPFLRITCVYELEYDGTRKTINHTTLLQIKAQLGRELSISETIYVLEFRRIYKWAIEKITKGV